MNTYTFPIRKVVVRGGKKDQSSSTILDSVLHTSEGLLKPSVQNAKPAKPNRDTWIVEIFGLLNLSGFQSLYVGGPEGRQLP